MICDLYFRTHIDVISSTRNGHLEDQIIKVQENVPYFGKTEFMTKVKVNHEAHRVDYQATLFFILDSKLHISNLDFMV